MLLCLNVDGLETGGRGERGRGKERGKGRGRGRNRQDAGSKDDASVASIPSVSQSYSENGIQPDAQQQQPQRPAKQRGRGRGAKGESEGRGRGRTNRAATPTETPAPPVSAKPSQDLPPGISVASSQLASISADIQKPVDNHVETRSGPWPGSLENQELPPVAQLHLSKPPGVFTPALDPLVNIKPDPRSAAPCMSHGNIYESAI